MFVSQAVQALTRARVFEHEHDLAVRLQRSLLPSDLPSVPGLALAGAYMAGGAGVEVGGDWYDAVVRPDGILQLCVGDVSGRGVAAATIMGRQRGTFRAYAYDCVSPAEILRRMIRHVGADEMITATCVTVDPLAGRIGYSCAGHPPPLLLDSSSGGVRRLDDASAPPLGVAEPDDIVETVAAAPGPGAARALHRRARRASWRGHRRRHRLSRRDHVGEPGADCRRGARIGRRGDRRPDRRRRSAARLASSRPPHSRSSSLPSRASSHPFAAACARGWSGSASTTSRPARSCSRSARRSTTRSSTPMRRTGTAPRRARSSWRLSPTTRSCASRSRIAAAGWWRSRRTSAGAAST